MNGKFKYQCTHCHKEYPVNKIVYLCPECESKFDNELPPKGVLKLLYNYESLLHQVTFIQLKQKNWLDILPINDVTSLPKLNIGDTPLYHVQKIGNEKLNFNLYLKDDSQNPTYSFKDRASAIVSAYAKENKRNTIVTASTGNAGSSIAGICAAQEQRAIVVVPASAPIAKLTQIIMCGATIIPINGTYDDAFDLSVKASNRFEWYNRNTAYNPLTVEGKKTVAFELYDQLNQNIPDLVFVPVGDGVILSGVYKGFEDLLMLDIINRMPVIVAVQSTGSDNLARNIDAKEFIAKSSQTIADSISVDYPRNFYMARDFLTKYNGEWITVTDKRILEASRSLASKIGLFAEPAAAAAYAGMLAYKKEHKIKNDSKVVVVLTGSGLKDISAVQQRLKIPKAIEPDIKILEQRFKLQS
jgi:threonine synthase